VKALKNADYFVPSHTDLDLNRFETAIKTYPEFMDCLLIMGDVDYICFI